MPKKYYSVCFSVDDINYTLKLTDSNLSTLADRLKQSLNLENPLEFFCFDALIGIQILLNSLGVAPQLNSFLSTDLAERWGFFQSVLNAFLESNNDRDPDWKSKLTDKERADIELLSGVLPIVDPAIVETIEVANADTIAD
jgi:hypothetical protein